MVSSKVRYVDWRPADWLNGTRGLLSQREVAVYDVVLNMIYDRGSEAPNDAAFIAGHFKPETPSHRHSQRWLTRSTRASLDRLIELGKLRLSIDGQWLTNGRAEAELGKANDRIGSASKAGVASGKVRRAKAALRPHRGRTDAALTQTETSNSNGLDRTVVRNYQLEESSLTSTDTVAARDPSPSQATARAPAKLTLDPRLAKAAAKARAKLLRQS